jgi:hypothetical protein
MYIIFCTGLRYKKYCMVMEYLLSTINSYVSFYNIFIVSLFSFNDNILAIEIIFLYFLRVICTIRIK